MGVKKQRCTGHCCKRFTLPYSPEDIQAQAEAHERGDKSWLDSKGGKHMKFNPDIEQIANMIIYLDRGEKNDLYLYTCGNLDKETGNCKIYEDRPSMCREYPYGKKCNFKGCTMKRNCGVEKAPEKKIVTL